MIKKFEKFRYNMGEIERGVSKDSDWNSDKNQDRVKNSKVISEVISEIEENPDFDMDYFVRSRVWDLIKKLEKMLEENYNHIVNDYEKNLIVNHFVRLIYKLKNPGFEY